MHLLWLRMLAEVSRRIWTVIYRHSSLWNSSRTAAQQFSLYVLKSRENQLRLSSATWERNFLAGRFEFEKSSQAAAAKNLDPRSAKSGLVVNKNSVCAVFGAGERYDVFFRPRLVHSLSFFLSSSLLLSLYLPSSFSSTLSSLIQNTLSFSDLRNGSVLSFFLIQLLTQIHSLAISIFLCLCFPSPATLSVLANMFKFGFERKGLKQRRSTLHQCSTLQVQVQLRNIGVR